MWGGLLAPFLAFVVVVVVACCLLPSLLLMPEAFLNPFLLALLLACLLAWPHHIGCRCIHLMLESFLKCTGVDFGSL